MVSAPKLSLETRAEGAGLVFIEQLHVNNPCTNPRAPHLLGIDPIDHRAIYVKGSCKMWSCRECGVANARQWVARVANGVDWYMKNGQTDWYLMTVTAKGTWRGTTGSLKNLRTGWRRLAQRIYRISGTSKYVRFYEHHKDGSLHMHFVTTMKIPYVAQSSGKFKSKWLKDNAASCGMGWNCDYSPIEHPAIAASYAAKYLAKTLEKNVWPKSLRRVQASNHWPELPALNNSSEYVWEFCASYGDILERAARLWQWQNLEVTSVPLGRVLNTDDFSEFLP